MKSQSNIQIGLIVILIAILLFREYRAEKQSNDLLKQVSEYNDQVEIERLRNGALITSKNSLELSTQKQIKLLAASLNDTIKQMIKKFKSVDNVTYITNKFEAGGDTIYHEQKIPCDFKPFKSRKNEKDYRFVGTIAPDYFSIDSLSITDNQSLVFGRKKVGFMKYDHHVDINHSNSLMVSTNVKNYTYSPEKKWWEKTWIHMLEGALIVSSAKKGYDTFIKK